MRKWSSCLLAALLLPVLAFAESWVRVPQSMVQPGWVIADVGSGEAPDLVCVAQLPVSQGFRAADDSGSIVHYRSAASQLWLAADLQTKDEAIAAFTAQLPETKAVPQRRELRMGGRVWQCVCASLAWGAVEGEPWRTAVLLVTDAPQGTVLRVTCVSADPDAASVLGSLPKLLCGLSFTGETAVFADTQLTWGMRARDVDDVYGEAIYTVQLGTHGWSAAEHVITLWDDSVAELDCLLHEGQLRMLLLVPQQMPYGQLAAACTERFGDAEAADGILAAEAFGLIRSVTPEMFAGAICWRADDAVLFLCVVEDMPVLLCLDPTQFVSASCATVTDLK